MGPVTSTDGVSIPLANITDVGQMVHTLDTPSVVPYAAIPDTGVALMPADHVDYAAAFDPSNKTQFSPNSQSPSITPNLTLVSPNYGYQAGATSIQPLIPNANPGPNATAPAKVQAKPSNLIIFGLLGVGGYFAWKHFKPRRK